jgi:stage II sporulation protein AA (anti-sigma F factor antagonist)
MDVVQDKDGDVAVFRLAGRFDSSAAASAEAELTGGAGGATPRLVLDLTRLDYISSAGLRVLLVLARKIQQASGKMALFGLKPDVRQVFTVSGFDTIISIQPDAAAALAQVR